MLTRAGLWMAAAAVAAACALSWRLPNPGLPSLRLPRFACPSNAFHRSNSDRWKQQSGSRSSSSAMTRRRGAASAADTAAAAQAVAELLQQHEDSGTLPSCIVFDLDYTLWPYWCEMMSVSHTPWLYPEVPAILDGLAAKGVQLAVASRTPTPHVASAFLDKLDLRQRFHSIQLIPAADGFDHTTAQKDTAHLPNIKRELGVEYSDMLFFDDEHKNVHKVQRLGVTSILVDTSTGVDLRALQQGLQAFAAAKERGG